MTELKDIDDGTDPNQHGLPPTIVMVPLALLAGFSVQSRRLLHHDIENVVDFFFQLRTDARS